MVVGWTCVQGPVIHGRSVRSIPAEGVEGTLGVEIEIEVEVEAGAGLGACLSGGSFESDGGSPELVAVAVAVVGEQRW